MPTEVRMYARNFPSGSVRVHCMRICMLWPVHVRVYVRALKYIINIIIVNAPGATRAATTLTAG